jgi:hypothetical protein
MKIYVPHCTQCSPSEQTILSHSNFLEIEDNLICSKICSNGHETIYHCSHFKWDLLFQFAVSAIAEGDKRMAILNFASALEEFHKFCIQVLLCSENIDYTTSRDFLSKHLKLSERQTGGFCLFYFSIFKEAPPHMSNNLIEIRNGVVHTGYIPNQKKSIEYGEAVRAIIINTLKKLKENFKEQINEILQKEFLDGFHKVKSMAEEKNCQFSSYSCQTIINFTTTVFYETDLNQVPLEELVLKLKNTHSYPAMLNRCMKPVS